MKLKYRILWFEDDTDYVTEDLGPEIKKFIEDRGFIFDCIHHVTGAPLDELIRSKNFDLIVTDLNLGSSETGEKLIDYIRDNKIYTEVLLYSANASELESIINNKGWVERASFSIGLGNLPQKFKDLIQLTIKKVEDVNNLRGLVISETIDLEKKIEGILMKFFGAVGENGVDEKKKELLLNIYEKKKERHENELKEVETVDFNNLHELIEKDILTAANSYDALQSVLKLKVKEVNAILNSGNPLEEEVREKYINHKEELENLKKELSNFRGEVLRIRNTLAHVKEEVGADGIPFLESINREGKKIVFTSEEYIKIRKDLMKHSDNLGKIILHI